MSIPQKLPFILDGATGTQFRKYGMPVGVSTEKWALDNPDTVIAVQRAYAEAGSDAVYAPTFGANRVTLASHNVDIKPRELILRLVELSRKAVGGNVLVGGDIAPTGLPLPPFGDTGFETLFDIFTEQASALDEAGVDFFAVETQMSLAEARASVFAVKAVSDKPVFVSFTCGDTGRTIYGGSLPAALVAMQDLGIAAFGINCCGDLSLLANLLQSLSEFAEVPLIVKPNAGLPEFDGGTDIYKMTPKELAGSIPELAQAGASVFGGCCGTDERHIREICEAVSGIEFQPGLEKEKEAYASERGVFSNSRDCEIAWITADDGISDYAEIARAEGADMIGLKIRSERELADVLNNQSALQLPVCVEVEGELKDRFRRGYHGKAMLV